MGQEPMYPLRLRLTEPDIKWTMDDTIIHGVITAAVRSVERQPGVWQNMIYALNSGAEKTTEGTVNAFLHRAMVDRLVEEYRALDSE